MIRWISPRFLLVFAALLFTVDLLLGMSVYRAYVQVQGGSSEFSSAPPSPKESRIPETSFPPDIENVISSSKEMILENNLFHPSRAGAQIVPLQVPEQAKPSTPPPEKSQLELVGVLISPQKRQAFIKNRAAAGDVPQKKWMKEGEKLWGVKMKGISRETVTLEADSTDRFTLNLYETAQKRDRGESSKQDYGKANLKTMEPPAASKPKAEPKPSQTKPVEKATDRENVTVISTPFGDYTLPQGKGQAPGSTTKPPEGFQ